MTAENDFDVIRFDGLSLGDLIRQLQEGGPLVDEAALLAYAVDALDESSRKAITGRIVTWKAWYRAYRELRAELSEWEAGENELRNGLTGTVGQDSVESGDAEVQPQRVPPPQSQSAKTRPLSMALGGESGDESSSNSYRITADECEWEPFSPALETAECLIDVRLMDGRTLQVTVRGFLFESDYYRLEASWRAGDGSELARGTQENPFVPEIVLTANGTRGIETGDTVELSSVYEPEEGSGWTARLRLPLRVN